MHTRALHLCKKGMGKDEDASLARACSPIPLANAKRDNPTLLMQRSIQKLGAEVAKQFLYKAVVPNRLKFKTDSKCI